MRCFKAFAIIWVLTGTQAAMSADIERFRWDDTSPYQNQFLESLLVPSGTDLLMLSGVTPPVIDATVPDDIVAAYGDTETQTRGILKVIAATLAKRGFAMNDIVKMQAFLVGDPAKGGKADFQAFSKAYLEFFGTSQNPNIPVRTRAQVTSLVWPGWLVEIEVIAAKRR